MQACVTGVHHSFNSVGGVQPVQACVTGVHHSFDPMRGLGMRARRALLTHAHLQAAAGTCSCVPAHGHAASACSCAPLQAPVFRAQAAGSCRRRGVGVPFSAVSPCICPRASAPVHLLPLQICLACPARRLPPLMLYVLEALWHSMRYEMDFLGLPMLNELEALRPAPRGAALNAACRDQAGATVQGPSTGQAGAK